MNSIWGLNYLIDTHCHVLPSLGYDVDAEMTKIQNSKVKQIVLIGCSISEASETVELAKTYDWIFPSIGIHPEETFKKTFNLIDQLDALENLIKLNRSSLTAIGECGLEYFYLDKHIKEEDREENKNLQKALLKAQVALAIKYKLPLIIHCRNGFDDLFEIIDSFELESHEFKVPIKAKGIIHSFTDNYKNAIKSIDKGFKIGVNGIITFKSSKDLRDTIEKVIVNKGIENIVLETDSPFLTPEPYRGKINSPVNIEIIDEFMRKLK